MTIILTVTLFAGGLVQAVTVTWYPSAFEQGYLYLDPRPESEYVAPETCLLIRLAEDVPLDQLDLHAFVHVQGEKSGFHAGRSTLASDGRTITFQPSAPFVENEAVDVILAPSFGDPSVAVIESLEYRFYVLRPSYATPSVSQVTAPATSAVTSQTSVQSQLLPAGELASGQPIIMINGVSVPSDFPQVYVAQNRNPADGYLFVDYSGPTHYTLILDNSGAPLWYRRGKVTEGFQVQRNGMITETQYSGYDQDFNWVKDFHATNGYSTDGHELQVLEDGGYLLLGLRTITNVDMSRFVDGGNPNATVHETCVQEFTPADELIFQWRAWENYDIARIGPKEAEDVRAPSVRVTHLNAIDVDRDGHLLVSSRHLSQLTKIDRNTGQVIWRLGGPNSDFVFVNDPLGGFSCQHDCRVVGPNRYTVFDNGTAHDPPVSRAVEYELDPNAMTATLVWEYRSTPDRYAYYQGNAQRLPNGNTLINFVLPEYPRITEVGPDGDIEFEMSFLNCSTTAYRAFRFPWTGVVEKPYLVVESGSDKVTLLFNKFGDPNVAFYRVYGGLEPQPETVMATCDQTLLNLRDLENRRRYYFRVTAVDFDGMESAFSNEENILVYLYDPSKPGENMIRNGDFSESPADWTLSSSEPGEAQWTVDEGRAHVTVTAEGTGSYDIRLIQSGLQLVQGETYVLEFDAGTTGARQIEVRVNKKNLGRYWDYAKMGPVYLSAIRQNLSMKHFSHTFTMTSETDLEACIEISIGGYGSDVYLDNVSLTRQAR